MAPSVAQRVTVDLDSRVMTIVKPDGSVQSVDIDTTPVEITSEELPAGAPETANGVPVQGVQRGRWKTSTSKSAREVDGQVVPTASKGMGRLRSGANGNALRGKATACHPERTTQTTVSLAGVNIGWVRAHARWCWSSGPLYVYGVSHRVSSWSRAVIYCIDGSSSQWVWDNGTNRPGNFRHYARATLRGAFAWGCFGPSQNMTAGIDGGVGWAYTTFHR